LAAACWAFLRCSTDPLISSASSITSSFMGGVSVRRRLVRRLANLQYAFGVNVRSPTGRRLNSSIAAMTYR
jgi:hypothetical protein